MATPARTIPQIGAAIRAARKRERISQEELAARAGTSRRWLSILESGGKAGVELAKVIAVLDALGLQIELAPIPTSEGSIESQLLADLIASDDAWRDE